MWSHKVDKEGHSEDAIVWDEECDESKEHLECLEYSKDAPEWKPQLSLLIIFGLDGIYWLHHWVDTCQKCFKHGISLHPHEYKC